MEEDVYVLMLHEEGFDDDLITIGVYTSKVKALVGILKTLNELADSEDIEELEDVKISETFKIARVKLNQRFMRHEDEGEEGDTSFLDGSEEIEIPYTFVELKSVLRESRLENLLG
ncbi:MAG: hypothetical protein SLAVMIC_01022 [uncultured marine phage]|uniref:Uncharacterized protein n=1 Tax=uncultured marine phage TaxID=707152 RepID=A0A8D9C9X7_9VIRU|nr:MAG: hypothetical protein SLAVMIC_01022 [uncultured marine phage]